MAKKRRRKTSSRRKTRRVSGDPSLAPSVVSGVRKRKKNKVYGKVRKHKRRVKGIGKVTGSDTGDMLLGLVLGAGAGIGAKILSDKFASGKGKIIAPIKILLGAAVAMKVKNPIARGAGMGFAAVGIMNAAKEFGMIQGMEEFIHGVGAGEKDTMLIEMNGVEYNSTKFISGTNDPQPSIVSGDEMSGDDGAVSGNTMPSVVS